VLATDLCLLVLVILSQRESDKLIAVASDSGFLLDFFAFFFLKRRHIIANPETNKELETKKLLSHSNFAQTL
jgi:hypothetical protein